MNKITLGLTIGSVAAVLLGVSANIIILNSQDDLMDRIHIKSNETVQESLDIDDLSLLPGEEQKYLLFLSSDLNGNYLVTFDYQSITLGGLEKFLDVTISHDDIANKYVLADLLNEGQVVEIPMYLDKDEKAIEIIYSLDDDVENDAQGAYVDFKIDITIQSR